MIVRALVSFSVLLAIFAIARADAAPVKIFGSTFSVIAPDGRTLSGRELAGANLIVQIDGFSTKIRIAAVRVDPMNPEIWLHDFRLADAQGVERPLCKPGPDGIAEGFPVAGRVNPDGTISEAADGHFELICTGGAEGKCVRFGYRPDKPGPGSDATMRDYYNSCVHLVRADYCGEGVGTTRNGMPIDVYDHIGVQPRVSAPDFTFEAAFGPHGALCVAHPRVRENITLEALARACPRLVGHLGPDQCSEGAAKDALLFVESK
jgi:hypothetical protein